MSRLLDRSEDEITLSFIERGYKDTLQRGVTWKSEVTNLSHPSQRTGWDLNGTAIAEVDETDLLFGALIVLLYKFHFQQFR